MVFSRSFLISNIQPIDAQKDDDAVLMEDIRLYLKVLLESEAPLIDLHRSFKEIKKSIFRFGIEDIQSMNYQSKKETFIGDMLNLIQTFEPRIEDVEITILDHDDNNTLYMQTVQFCIEGSLRDGHPFVFNSALNLNLFSVGMESDID